MHAACCMLSANRALLRISRIPLRRSEVLINVSAAALKPVDNRWRPERHYASPGISVVCGLDRRGAARRRPRECSFDGARRPYGAMASATVLRRGSMLFRSL